MKIFCVIRQTGYDGDIEYVKVFTSKELADDFNKFYGCGMCQIIESELENSILKPNNEVLRFSVHITLAKNPKTYGSIWAELRSYQEFLNFPKKTFELSKGSLTLYVLEKDEILAKELAVKICDKLVDAGKMPYATDKIEKEKCIRDLTDGGIVYEGLEYRMSSLSGSGNPFLRLYPENIHLDEEFINIIQNNILMMNTPSDDYHPNY